MIKIDTKGNYIVEHLGRTYQSKFYKELDDDTYNKVKEDFYSLPSKQDVFNQLKQISLGGVKINYVNEYYFKDLMFKTQVYYNNWSIEELIQSKELLSICNGRIVSHPDFYPEGNGLYVNLRRFLQLGGKGIASEVYNFPLKVINTILETYNVNNNYYDFSCGWGSRLLSSLAHKVNYFGTDPNNILCERLNQLKQDFDCVCNTKTYANIYCQGSEVYIEELHNRIGLVFSSPPYFCLEDYKIGNQSYKVGMTLSDWFNSFMVPTIRNIYDYLIDDGYFLININDFNNYELVNTTISIAKDLNFNLLGSHKLKNIQRCNTNGGFNDNSENILVFCKKDSTQKLKEFSFSMNIDNRERCKKLF